MNPALDPTRLPLRDIHLPEAVGWWPPAFGWWILVGALLLGAAVWAIRYRAGWRHRAASVELRAALATLQRGGDPVLCAQRFSTTLRRFAMTASEQPDRVAGLTGEPWLAWLDSRWEREAFSRGAGRGLLSAPWVGAGRLDRERCIELGRLCLSWVDSQRVRRGRRREPGDAERTRRIPADAGEAHRREAPPADRARRGQVVDRPRSI